MDRGRMFEAVAVLLVLVLGGVLFAGITGGSPSPPKEEWNISAISPTAYTYAGDDGRLFVFDSNDVYAIGNGTLQWQYSVPAGWSIINLFYDFDQDPQVQQQYYNGPIFASSGDTLYLYAMPDPAASGQGFEDRARQPWGGSFNGSMSDEKVMAIADGRLLWERQLSKGTHEYSAFGGTRYDNVGITVEGDRLYVYHPYNLTVLRTDGTLLGLIADVACPPAVDEDNKVYTVKAISCPDEEAYTNDYTYFMPYQGYMVPSGVIEAYFPDGSLCWRIDIGEPARRPVIDPGIGRERQTLPLSNNGLLYVPRSDGVTILGRDSHIIREFRVNNSVIPYDKMPFDDAGNYYLTDAVRGYQTAYPPGDTSKYLHGYVPPTDRKIYAVRPDGTYTVANESYDGLLPIAASDGIAYFVTSTLYDPDRPSLDELLAWTITAVSLENGDVLWSRPVDPGPASMAMVNESSVGWIFYDDTTRVKTRAYYEWHPSAWRDQSLDLKVWGDAAWIEALPRGDIVYFSYYSLNYEYPTNYDAMGPIWLKRYPGDLEMIDVTGRPYFAIINRSQCAYASGILALANDGRTLWQTPTGSYVTGMAANNSTIFYGTRNGGLAARNSGIAAGLAAILAAAYVFLRFVLVGAVARAKSRLEKNENRTAVLHLIQERPGSTMREISRELDMNIGTMRYHLLILGINHKIKEHRDGKYVRYFAGTCAYTIEEREIISLLRREPVRRLMLVIRGKPGISNVELAEALGLSEAAVSNYMRELAGRGFVDKESTKDGHVAYFIKRERADKITSSLDQS
ncbi:MAG: winged helix-turn-helix transcriptional regulator [Methanocella sp.]